MNALANLPEKWRATAEAIAKPYGFVTEHTLGKAEALSNCADELTAALSPAELGGVEWLEKVRDQIPRRVQSESLDDLNEEELSIFDNGYNAALTRVHNILSMAAAALANGEHSTWRGSLFGGLSVATNVASVQERCCELCYGERWMKDGTPCPSCNRTGRRGHALSTPRAAEAVTDEMVEVGCIAMCVVAETEWPEDYDEEEQERCRRGMRAALTAALTPPSAKGENSDV